jgi:hypothetical protein
MFGFLVFESPGSKRHPWKYGNIRCFEFKIKIHFFTGTKYFFTFNKMDLPYQELLIPNGFVIYK